MTIPPHAFNDLPGLRVHVFVVPIHRVHRNPTLPYTLGAGFEIRFLNGPVLVLSGRRPSLELALTTAHVATHVLDGTAADGVQERDFEAVDVREREFRLQRPTHETGEGCIFDDIPVTCSGPEQSEKGFGFELRFDMPAALSTVRAITALRATG